MQESTKSSLDSSRILAYLSSVHLGPGSDWRGTYEGFIIHWEDKVCLFNELVPTRDSLSFNRCKILLQNSVMNVKALAAVKAQADQMKVHTGTDLTYEQYVNL